MVKQPHRKENMEGTTSPLGLTAGHPQGRRHSAIRIRRISGGAGPRSRRIVVQRKTGKGRRRAAAAVMALLLVLGAPQAILVGLGMGPGRQGSVGGAGFAVGGPAPTATQQGTARKGAGNYDSLRAPETGETRTGTVVTVESGDTIWNLAKVHGSPELDIRTTVDAIIAANDLGGSFIRPGMELYIP